MQHEIILSTTATSSSTSRGRNKSLILKGPLNIIATLAVGSSHAFLSIKEDKANKIRHNNKTDTAQNTGSNNDEPDIRQPSTAVV